jgi:hypothetical protein
VSIPIRWRKVWTPGSPNILEYFQTADVPWRNDEHYQDAWRTRYEWNYDMEKWGEWIEVPVVDV